MTIMMPEKNAAPVVVKPKWFLKSKTIWGAIVSAATIAAPIISQLTGVDVTPIVDAAGKVVEEGSTVLDQVLKGAGGLLGAWLVFKGRFSKKMEQVAVAPNAEPVVAKRSPKSPRRRSRRPTSPASGPE
jgi:hypothetical protein